MSKIIAVVGATGAQGNGLLKSILADPEGGFSARALTRDPSKESAVALKEAGAEVIAFDLDKPETFGPAFDGAYGLFVVTNFWESMDPEKEREQAKAIAEAATKAGIQHILWSTLEDTTAFFDSLDEAIRPPKIHGRYVPHLDEKGRANAFFPKAVTTNVYTSFYFENMYGFGMVANGVFCNNMGDAPLPAISAVDIGKCCYGILKAGDKYKGEDVYVVGDNMTATEIMAVVSEVTGKKFSYSPVDRATYAGFGFPGADDLANMFEFFRLDPGFTKRRDVSVCKALNPELLDTKAWATLHKEDMLKLAAA